MARNAARSNVNEALTSGVGGLQFNAVAPPGLGRLIRIPFYLTTTVAGFAALGTGQTPANVTANLLTGSPSATVPVIMFDPANLAAAGASDDATLFTPQISWATLRMVGFETSVSQYVLPAAPPAETCFRDLQIGGGATLFVHEDFAPSRIYAAGQGSFAGLRDYPIIESPNVAQVTTEIIGVLTSPRITFSASLVCEILTDDNYGSHIPGPYARPGALVRQGGSFTN